MQSVYIHFCLYQIFPDNETMRAQKNFKSTTESQCFGGAAFGFEVCFQWNAWVADRPNVRSVSSRKGRRQHCCISQFAR